ncbi:MAG: hypothetical protein ABIF88_01750 [archaeon]
MAISPATSEIANVNTNPTEIKTKQPVCAIASDRDESRILPRKIHIILR